MSEVAWTLVQRAQCTVGQTVVGSLVGRLVEHEKVAEATVLIRTVATVKVAVERKRLYFCDEPWLCSPTTGNKVFPARSWRKPRKHLVMGTTSAYRHPFRTSSTYAAPPSSLASHTRVCTHTYVLPMLTAFYV